LLNYSRTWIKNRVIENIIILRKDQQENIGHTTRYTGMQKSANNRTQNSH